jgi:hypothetical protein
MKTPREILLQQHEAATTKLDAVRETALAEITAKTATESLPVRESFVITLWRELFWSCRRVWAGLAAIWIAMLVISAATSDSPRSSVASAPTSYDWKMALQAQRQLTRQLLEQDSAPVAAAVPGRRSELHDSALIG